MLVFALPILLVFLFVLERILYGRLWKRGLESDVRFSSTIVRSGEGVEISDKCVNNSFLPLTSLSLEWNLERQFSPLGVEIIYLPHTDGISSTQLTNYIKKILAETYRTNKFAGGVQL